MNILLTGATGFLGTELVKRLVKDRHHVHVIARNPSRVNDLLQAAGENREYIHLVEGELTEERLGMKEYILTELKGKIDVIYHIAAFLSFDEAKQEEIFQVNVEGTRHLLRVAEHIQPEKFLYVSTAYTLGARTEGKEELYPLNSSFINAYEESKCHAEHLVMSYQDKFNVSIMRPSIIIGDSETGEANTTFGLYGMMRTIELLQKKQAKRQNDKTVYRFLIEKDTVSNIVPVNFVVDLLIAGMNYAKKNTVYHIVNPKAPSNEEVFEIIKEVYNFYNIQLLSFEEKHSLTEAEVKINKPLNVFKDYLNRSIHFEDENTKELLTESGISGLNMDKDMIVKIVQGFKNRK